VPSVRDGDGMRDMTTTIGLTGTRDLPKAATDALCQRLDQLHPDVWVTGACVGVDAYVGMWARLARPDARHVVYVPADRSRIKAWWRTLPSDNVEVIEMPPGSSYRDRNQAIVNASTRLIAIPVAAEDHPEQRRSGTWQTVRMGRRAGIMAPEDVWLVTEMMGVKATW
jgi:hypothetical protein